MLARVRAHTDHVDSLEAQNVQRDKIKINVDRTELTY